MKPLLHDTVELGTYTDANVFLLCNGGYLIVLYSMCFFTLVGVIGVTLWTNSRTNFNELKIGQSEYGYPKVLGKPIWT